MADILESQLRETITKSLPITKISQGAEALVFLCNEHPFNDKYREKVILKYRPPKKYRHETLDNQLTKHRTLAEARLLSKLYQNGVNVPCLIFVDPRKGLIWMENIEGVSLKQWIWDCEDKGLDIEEMKDTIIQVGHEIGSLHLLEIVHGDLTSSNVILRTKDQRLQPVLIDFGLAGQSGMAEDKAVDLYVLERAVESTHPVCSHIYNEWLLQGYFKAHEKDNVSAQKLKEVVKRLESVRARGRKRSMLG
jgi:TP53 regulating kinase and related kinases